MVFVYWCSIVAMCTCVRHFWMKCNQTFILIYCTSPCHLQTFTADTENITYPIITHV